MHLLALTFKHAVEFSSFGCTPRGCFINFRLGQLDLLYSVFPAESNPSLRPFGCSKAFPNDSVLLCFNLSYFIQIFTRSQIRLSDLGCPLRVDLLSRTGSGATWPTLPGLLGESNSLRISWPHPCFATLVPVVVLQSAQDQELLGLGWVPLGSAAAQVDPLAASRTPQGSENITRVFPPSQIGPV